jgi:predicted phage terminase large subunit-like protein
MPHPAQSQIIESARRFNVLACGRRFGKTSLGIELAERLALHGQPVGWFSPTYKSLAEAWRDIKLSLAPVTRSKSETEHRIELIDGGVLECWTLDDPDAGRGRKYARVIIDEAAIVRHLEEAWAESIRPTLTDLQGDAWFMSTPKGFNYFHTLFERGMDPAYPQYASWQMPSAVNPHLPPSEIEAARADTVERVFRQEYEASFVDDATMIFEREWWAGQNRYDPEDKGIPYRSIARWCSWDTAMKDKVTNAYTARVAGELMPNYQLLITHVYRERLTFPSLPAIIGEDARRYYYLSPGEKLREVLIEDKSSGTSALQTLRASAEPWLVPLLKGFEPNGNKQQRAEQAAVWCRNGCVLLPHPSSAVPWLMDFENELYTAPQSEFMDQVDAFSQLILYLENYLASGWHARGGKAA